MPMYKQPKLPRLNAIVAFKTAAEAGSFARAATRMALTPAAVSQQIRQLEAQLGVVVFTRTQSGVQLTEAGRDYLRYVSEAFDILQLAQQNLRSERVRNQLTLFALPALASKWIAPRLQQWLQYNPDSDLALHATHAWVDFASSAADFALCFGDDHYPHMEQQPLFQDEVVPVCSPRIVNGALNPLDLPLIHLDWGNDGRYLPGWRDWQQEMRHPPQKPLPGLTFNLTSLAIDAAVQGNGVLLGQRRLIQKELQDGSLVIVDPRALPLRKPYFIAYPKRTLSKPGAAAMLNWLTQLS